MTELQKGDWAICNGEYVQIEMPVYRRDFMVCRKAGSNKQKCINIKRLTLATLTPDFSKAKEGDECWMYGIGETVISSIGDDYVTIWDDENKYVFDKSGYLYFIGEYIGGAYIHGVSCELEESPMLFNSFSQFQAYWAEQALEVKK